MPSDPAAALLLRRIRVWLSLFVLGLVISGLTAFALETEMTWLAARAGPPADDGLARWLATIRDALADENRRYPFLAYGTDWLAFSHLVIAVAFIGPLVDPVRNRWVIAFGLIACAAVVPMALIAGGVRGIPIAWRLIDCSFAVAAAVPLAISYAYARRLEDFRDDPPPTGGGGLPKSEGTAI
jgi:hypothetical protein